MVPLKPNMEGYGCYDKYSPTGYPAPVNTRSFWGDPAPVKRTLWPGPRPGPKKGMKSLKTMF